MAVLDLCCGMGRTCRHVAPLVKEYHGVDFAEGMIAKAREYNAGVPNASFHVNDGRSLGGFADGTFDLVYCELAYQHMPKGTQAAYTSEVHRVLRNGRAVLCPASARRVLRGRRVRPDKRRDPQPALGLCQCGRLGRQERAVLDGPGRKGRVLGERTAAPAPDPAPDCRPRPRCGTQRISCRRGHSCSRQGLRRHPRVQRRPIPAGLHRVRPCPDVPRHRGDRSRRRLHGRHRRRPGQVPLRQGRLEGETAGPHPRSTPASGR